MTIPGGLLDRIEQLEPLPRIVNRLFELLTVKEIPLDQIASAIELDGGLSLRIMRAANSSLFGRSLPVYSVRDAVVRLGLDRMIEVAMGGHLKDHFSDASLYGIDGVDLWLHSAASSLAAREVMHEKGTPPLPSYAPVAALLHDVGKTLIDRYCADENPELRQRCQEKKSSIVRIEQSVLGFDHAEIGGAVCAKWKLPDDLCRAVEVHHRLPLLRESLLADTVVIANLVAKSIGAGHGDSGEIKRSHRACLSRLRIDPKGFERVCGRASLQLAEVRCIYGMVEN